jgi:hypothetical protein
VVTTISLKGRNLTEARLVDVSTIPGIRAHFQYTMRTGHQGIQQIIAAEYDSLPDKEFQLVFIDTSPDQVLFYCILLQHSAYVLVEIGAENDSRCEEGITTQATASRAMALRRLPPSKSTSASCSALNSL